MKRILTLALAALMILTLAACGSEPVVKVIEIELTEEEYAFGVDKDQPELLTKVNEFIAKIQKDGTFDEITNKYFGDGTPTPVVSAARDTSKDQLVVATNAAFAPYEYKKGDKFVGIDMEIAKLIADHLGLELVIEDMDFDAVVTSVGKNGVDVAMAGLSVTATRKQSVNFTDPYYEGAYQVLVVKKDNTEFDACTTKEQIEEILNSK